MKYILLVFFLMGVTACSFGSSVDTEQSSENIFPEIGGDSENAVSSETGNVVDTENAVLVESGSESAHPGNGGSTNTWEEDAPTDTIDSLPLDTEVKAPIQEIDDMEKDPELQNIMNDIDDIFFDIEGKGK